MHPLIFFVLAFVALATAVPYAIRHDHPHARRAFRANLRSLDLRSTSYDGSCGSWSGATCPAGFCCGSDGWCGNAVEHCGVGCQSGFGRCGPAGSAEPSSAVESNSTEAQTTPAVNSAISASVTATFAPNVPSTSGGFRSGSGSGSGSDSDSDTQPYQDAPHSVATTLAGPPPASSLPQQSSIAATAPAAQPTSSPVSLATSTQLPSVASTSVSVAPSAAPSSASTQVPSGAGTTVSAAPSPASPSAAPSDTTPATGQPYIKVYRGNGSPSAGWPDENQWLSFEQLWEINQPIMRKSCTNLGDGADNTDQELDMLKATVKDLADQAGISTAFAYAIMQQESGGCVRVHTTSWSVQNPGLFQSHEGQGTCNATPVPCPQSEIHQMVQDGIDGTATGDGLKQLFGKATGTGAQKYYQVARMYNSGSVDASGDLGRNGATSCYCSDIANRLTGWSVGTSSCRAADVAL